MKTSASQGCFKTGMPETICGHCLYPELYKIGEEIARAALAKCNERALHVQSEMPYKAGFILETAIQIMQKAV